VIGILPPSHLVAGQTSQKIPETRKKMSLE
jgi:hypothetical protein